MCFREWKVLYFDKKNTSQKYGPKDPTDNNPALIWIMAWRRIGDSRQSLSEPNQMLGGGWVVVVEGGSLSWPWVTCQSAQAGSALGPTLMIKDIYFRDSLRGIVLFFSTQYMFFYTLFT